jgi:hypothetical protein
MLPVMKVWFVSAPTHFPTNAARMLNASMDYFLSRRDGGARLRVRCTRCAYDARGESTGLVLQVWRDALYVHQFGIEIEL